MPQRREGALEQAVVAFALAREATPAAPPADKTADADKKADADKGNAPAADKK